MISGMRLTRRSGYARSRGYKFYRLLITGAGTDRVRLARWFLRSEEFPDGEVSGGTITASSETGAPGAQGSAEMLVAYAASGALAWMSAAPPPQWVQYEFPTPVIVTEYGLAVRSTRSNAPTDWQLLASNNGSTWKQIDIRSEENIPLSATVWFDVDI